MQMAFQLILEIGYETKNHIYFIFSLLKILKNMGEFSNTFVKNTHYVSSVLKIFQYMQE